MSTESADLVVIGAGTLGGWASYFAASEGAKVIVLEKGVVGQGASSRAAGVVRQQGGNAISVELGRWSVDFYNRQQALLGTDSGFHELGYVILALTQRDVREGKKRVEMQRAAGLGEVRWADVDEICRLNPTLAREGHRGGSYLSTDGAVDPPRNVLAYSLAMQRAGVELRERTAFAGLRVENGRVTGVRTAEGDLIPTERVILTGGPELRRVGKLAGTKVWAGAVRHQIAVTEPHEAFADEGGTHRLPMMFDLGAGLYWRQEEQGLLFGMNNPKEVPGTAREIDWPYLRRMQRRLVKFVPAAAGLGLRKAWAATIEYTPDHQPILGPALTMDGGEPIEGTVVASACGHGMMWGPAVARVAADLATAGKTDLVDISGLGLDRFDEEGRSSLEADPIALPFPVSADEDDDDD